MFQLSMDGPSTNWKVPDLFRSQWSNIEVPPLLDIERYGLHVIHAAFCTGVKSTSWDSSKTLKAMWQIFPDSPGRSDIYENHCEEFP